LIDTLRSVESGGESTREELLLLLSAKDATIAALTALVEQQAVQVAGLVARVAELERRQYSSRTL
jgi:hypothetical protein